MMLAQDSRNDSDKLAEDNYAKKRSEEAKMREEK